MAQTVSMIIPIYNVQAYLPRCLDSILAQTYTELEIILVDDGSTDESGTICDSYAAKDSRIRVIHKENGGLGYARNSGLDIATGEFIFFLDSDDHLSSDAIRVLHAHLTADGSDMAAGKFVFEFPDGKVEDSYCRWMYDTVMTGQEVLRKTNFPVCAWGKLYRREIFDGLRFTDIACAEDLWLFPHVLERCEKVSVVDHVVCYYYQRWNSLVYTKSQRTLTATLQAKLHMTCYLLDRGELRAARHYYHTAIGTATEFPDRRLGAACIKDAFTKAQRRKLSSLVAQVRWLGIRFPKLYRLIYRHALRILYLKNTH